MAKYRMGSVLDGGVSLTCSMGRVWPPILLRVYEDIEDIRHEESMDAYQRVQVWQRVCGLGEMSSDKCPSCPHVLRDGEPTPKSEGSPIPGVRLSRGGRKKR
jgi:hypothetical protein